MAPIASSTATHALRFRIDHTLQASTATGQKGNRAGGQAGLFADFCPVVLMPSCPRLPIHLADR
jgi:hypothetical protein